MPRQIPRYGTSFSLAYLAARIMPSTPRMPNPPGTRMPWALRILSQASVCSVLLSACIWQNSGAYALCDQSLCLLAYGCTQTADAQRVTAGGWVLSCQCLATQRLPCVNATCEQDRAQAVLKGNLVQRCLAGNMLGTSDVGSRWLASTQSTSNLRLADRQACCSAFRTLRYASESPVYLPTMAILTTALRASHFSASPVRQTARKVAMTSDMPQI